MSTPAVTHDIALSPNVKELCFLPLGGCGEIGMNMNLYGHDHQWLMVDCGVTFKRYDDDGNPIATNEVYSADPSFIAQRRDALVGLVITHAHEDHVGAVAYLWPRLRCPIYTTAFTAEVLRRKLAQVNLLDKVPIHVVANNSTHTLGVFSIEWLALTHSLPDAQAVVIRTPVGSVFHTGDWKIDREPVVGEAFDPSRFQALANENISAMVCDSTNANVAGRSVSESEVYTGLHTAVRKATGRVVVTCFGSNIARLVQLAHIANEHDRQFAVLGRSLLTMVSIAKHCGYWPSECKVIDAHHLGYLPSENVLAVATGSQGEARTALFRLASDDHFDLQLQADDTVIFSSRVIPGNETSVEALVAKLREKKIHVVLAESSEHVIHASGHPCAQELDDLYGWVQPAIAIPVHGEPEHMQANAAIARKAGVSRQFTGTNGDVFYLAPTPRVRRGVVTVGQLRVSK